MCALRYRHRLPSKFAEPNPVRNTGLGVGLTVSITGSSPVGRISIIQTVIGFPDSKGAVVIGTLQPTFPHACGNSPQYG